MNNKGQISLAVAIITAGGMIIAAAITGWAAANTKTADVQRQVSVIEEREGNHYLELKEKLENIDKKIDRLLLK